MDPNPGLNGRKNQDNNNKAPSSGADSPQTSIIEQLLPLTSSWHQSSVAHSAAPAAMHSSFGAANFSLLGLHRQSQQQPASSSSPFYQTLANFASDFGAPSSLLLDNLSSLNSLDTQMDASDSGNRYLGFSSFSPSDRRRQLLNQTRYLIADRQGEDSTCEPQAATGKTYSSVLHSSSQPALSTLQQQQQQADRLALLDIQQQSSLNKSGEFLPARQDPARNLAQTGSGAAHGGQHFQAPARFFNDVLSIADRRQQQQQDSTFHQQHLSHHCNQLKGAGQLGQYRGANNTVASSQARAAADRSPAYNVAGANSNKSRRGAHKMSPNFSGGGAGYLGEGQLGFKLDAHGTGVVNSDETARFSRKVFVGGLPPDIDEEEIKASFRRFGALVVDWPHKAESKSYFPPKGYAFLLFQEEVSVQALIDSCFQDQDKLYLCVSSPTIKDKPVQVRPWRLSDSNFVLDSSLALDPRKTVFVGGVPRPLKASELATIMNNLYGRVCYAGIDTDPELKYPKGAGRVAFSSHQSYIAAISARFVHIHHSELEKRVEVKPYVLDDQFCDECRGARCNNKFAPFFCANITCLRYYCDSCWSSVHSQAGKEFHKPLVKEGGDRPRGTQSSFRW